MTKSHVLIVGAGLTGLTAARRLQHRGVDSVVVDKGRAVGGRMATRRLGEARFDHGAQHFSARSAAFQAEVDAWVTGGIARTWYHGASITQPERGIEPRYAGADGMRSIPEALAEGLDVRLGVAIDRLEATSDGRVIAASGAERTTEAAAVILTPPLPQSRLLLDVSGVTVPDHIEMKLEGVAYDPCLAVMAHLDGPSGLPDGHCALTTGPVAWLADNHHKGVSAVPALTIHSSPEFAADHIDDDDPTEWANVLCHEAARHLDADITDATPHGWRFSQPRSTLDVGALGFAASFPVVLAGEVFAGAKVEGAFTSGVAAAAAVLDYL